MRPSAPPPSGYMPTTTAINETISSEPIVLEVGPIDLLRKASYALFMVYSGREWWAGRGWGEYPIMWSKRNHLKVLEKI